MHTSLNTLDNPKVHDIFIPLTCFLLLNCSSGDSHFGWDFGAFWWGWDHPSIWIWWCVNQGQESISIQGWGKLLTMLIKLHWFVDYLILLYIDHKKSRNKTEKIKIILKIIVSNVYMFMHFCAYFPYSFCICSPLNTLKWIWEITIHGLQKCF